MLNIHATVLADTHMHGCRITTMQLRYPRFVHPEMMTHRLFARNARSSRAVPIEKMIQEVRRNPARPVEWGRNQKGMVAGEEILTAGEAETIWGGAALSAIEWAELLQGLTLHKQVVNRVLEPFLHIDVIVTATDRYNDSGVFVNPWGHFFRLRCANDADPTIRELARKMVEVYEESIPRADAWHLPYISDEEKNGSLRKLLEMSTARCARISYKPHDMDKACPEKDIALCQRLIKDGHHSPLEHAALATQEVQFGVLYGWQSFRYVLREDSWIKKP